MRKLLWIDFETSGIDPVENRPCSVHADLTDTHAYSIQGSFGAHMRVAPEFWSTWVNPANGKTAQDVNGYDESKPEWVHASSEAYVARALHDLTADVTLAGAGISFDRDFLAALYRRHGLEPNWHYQLLDLTSAIGIPLFYAGKIASPSLRHIAAFFGLTQPEPHTARADVELCRKIWASWRCETDWFFNRFPARK